MKNMCKFIVFIASLIGIFFIKNIIILSVLLCLSILSIRFLNISITEIGYDIYFFLPFLIITFLFNIFLGDLYEAILILFRIILCFNITYIFSKQLTVVEFANTISKLLYPFKIFNINICDIEIMISISLCMIPILRNEINMTIQTIKSKGGNLSIMTLGIFIKPTIISLFRKTNQIEKTLISKAYIE